MDWLSPYCLQWSSVPTCSQGNPAYLYWLDPRQWSLRSACTQAVRSLAHVWNLRTENKTLFWIFVFFLNRVIMSLSCHYHIFNCVFNILCSVYVFYVYFRLNLSTELLSWRWHPSVASSVVRSLKAFSQKPSTFVDR